MWNTFLSFSCGDTTDFTTDDAGVDPVPGLSHFSSVEGRLLTKLPCAKRPDVLDSLHVGDLVRQTAALERLLGAWGIQVCAGKDAWLLGFGEGGNDQVLTMGNVQDGYVRGTSIFSAHWWIKCRWFRYVIAVPAPMHYSSLVTIQLTQGLPSPDVASDLLGQYVDLKQQLVRKVCGLPF